MITIYNLFGGPGSGKSTTAAGFFNLLKLRKKKIELVTEFAKDAVYEQREKTLDNQFYVTAKQHHRIWRIIKYWKENGINDGVIVTDSPFILGLIYLKTNDEVSKKFKDFVIAEYNQTNNVNVFIRRVKEYDKIGRLQTENEAKEIDNKIKNFLKENNLLFIEIDGDENATKKLLEIENKRKLNAKNEMMN